MIVKFNVCWIFFFFLCLVQRPYPCHWTYLFSHEGQEHYSGKIQSRHIFQICLKTRPKVFWSPSLSAKQSETQVVHYCTRISESLVTQRNSNWDTSHSWSRTQTVTYPSTNIAHCRLTSVSRQILITLRHNSWKSRDKKNPQKVICRSASSIEARA